MSFTVRASSVRARRRVVVAATAGLLVSATAAGVATASSGIDVASYQHPRGHVIQWERVRATGLRFVFVKATEGSSYTNPYFSEDWRNSRSAGLFHGAYEFARPSRARGSASHQAHRFAATVGDLRKRGSLPPVLDLEVTGGLRPHQLVGWVARWMSAAKRLTHRTPMIYTYPYFWLHDMRNSHRFRHDRLWVADYASHPQLFGGWRHWTFWQFSSGSRVKGITNSKVDMNRYSGSLASLRALARAPKLPTPPVPTPSPTPPLPLPSMPNLPTATPVPPSSLPVPSLPTVTPSGAPPATGEPPTLPPSVSPSPSLSVSVSPSDPLPADSTLP